MRASAPPERTPALAGRNGDETNCTPETSSPRVVSQPSCLSPLPHLADLRRKASFADPALDIRTLQGLEDPCPAGLEHLVETRHVLGVAMCAHQLGHRARRRFQMT